MIDILSSAFIFFLPFTNSLTFVWLGIPVKIYEVVSLPLFFYLILKKKELLVPLSFLIFTVWTIISTLWSIPYIDRYLELGWMGRENPIISVAVRFLYAGYFVISFGIIIFFLKKYGIKWILMRFIGAGLFVVLYHAINTFTFVVWKRIFLLPNSSQQFMNFSFGQMFRNGTFHEGNYVGLYYLLCLIFSELLIYRSKSLFWLRGIFILGVLLTFSTTSYIGLVVFYTIVSVWNKWFLRLALFWSIVIGLVIFIPQIRAITYGKFFGQDKHAHYSMNDREKLVTIGLKIFKEHPIVGVGLGNYGYNFPRFIEKNINGKVIANNVYVSLLAETGIVGFILYLFFLWDIGTRIAGIQSRFEKIILFSAFICVIVVFNAFPSYEMTFLNVFFALAHRYNDSFWSS